MKKKTKTRIRDFNVGNTLTVGELKNNIQSLPDDTAIVLKCGGKNFNFSASDELMAIGKLVLRGYR